jgi:glycopeptide antibiotics resistance protein
MKFAPDKQKHFFVGILMGALLQGLGLWLLPTSLVVTTIIVLVIVIAISYGFELFSKVTGLGVHEIMDAIFSIVGGVVGMGIITLFFI